MPYDPRLVAPMRDEMVRMGARELKTVAEVYGLATPPAASAVFNRAFLPPKAERPVR